MSVNTDIVKETIIRALSPTHIEVVDESDGCGAKFSVVSNFNKMNSLKQK